jgi:hypothetical protein
MIVQLVTTGLANVLSSQPGRPRTNVPDCSASITLRSSRFAGQLAGTRRSVVTAFDLEGRTAVVTGGNGGIGLGIVTALGETGADIVWWARDADKPQWALCHPLDAGAADS